MSSQKGNVTKCRTQKYQNKSAFKNVYHDTSIQTRRIVDTDVAGVCARCKDCIDWKIKYKKYKPLTQPKTCVICKQKTIMHAYHVTCIPCSKANNKCAKCGEKKGIVQQPKLSEAEQASGERELQFQLEQLPERKRRTFTRLQDKGLLTGCKATPGGPVDSSDDNNDEGDTNVIEDIIDCDSEYNQVDQNVANKTDNQSSSAANAVGIISDVEDACG